jgi:hypothetical protein
MNDNAIPTATGQEADLFRTEGGGPDDPRPQLGPCSDTVGRLWDYLDDAISAGDREQVEAHLLACRSCRGQLSFAEALRELLASDEEAGIPPPIKARLERFVQAL